MGIQDQVILDRLYELLVENLRWPTWEVLDHDLFTNLGVGEPLMALRSTPEGMVWGVGSQHPSDQQEVGLSLRGLAACQRAASDLELFVRSVRRAAELCRDVEPPAVPVLEMADVAVLMAGVDDADRRLARQVRLWQVASGLWSAIAFGDDSRPWRVTLNRRIVRLLGDSQSIEDVLAVADPQAAVVNTPSTADRVTVDQSVAVVFVHGLFSSDRAWDVMEPLVARLPGVSTYRFTYASPKLPRFMRRVPSHADAADALATFISGRVSEQRVVLVTHSQGGHVALQYIERYLLQRSGLTLPPLDLVVMYACPNVGSDFASVPRRLTMGWNRQERSLRPLARETAEVVRRVHLAVAESSPPEIATRIVAVAGISDAVVTPTSAKGFWPSVEVVDGTHSTIIRPSSETDDRFLVLEKHLRTLRESPALVVVNGATGADTLGIVKDIERLKKRSVSNMERLRLGAGLPLPGRPHVRRRPTEVLTAAGRGNVLVVGDAGAGKSGVIFGLAESKQATETVVMLLASDVAGSNRLHLDDPLPSVLAALDPTGGLLCIDGVDALRGSEDRTFLSRVVDALAGTGWQVVASVRSFDALNSAVLRGSFTGVPLSEDPSLCDSRLRTTSHMRVGDLTEAEVDALDAGPLMRQFLDSAPVPVRALVRNLFNLRLVAEIVVGGGSGGSFSGVRTRRDLLQRYWEQRVLDEDQTARTPVLQRVTHAMVEARSLEVVASEPVVLGSDQHALDALLSRGVLTEIEGPIAGAPRVVTYAHNILFDYATALYVLYSPKNADGLIAKMDSDPGLPLVTRPGFDLLADLLWATEREASFWPRMLQIGGSEHELAAVAFMARVAQLVTEPSDLLPLVGSEPHAPGTGMSPRQKLVHFLVAALASETLLPDPTDPLPALVSLAEGLAGGAQTYTDLALATELLRALQNRVPVSRDSADSRQRGRAVADLLDACRSDAAQMEALAGALTWLLPPLVASSVETRDAVGRLISDKGALSQWGGTVLRNLPDVALAVVPVDPVLARDLAVTAASFVETREEDVSIGAGSVLPLRESRKQQAQMTIFQLSELFPKMCDLDLVTAAAIMCDVVNADLDTSEADQAEWPLVCGDATGWLTYGTGLGSTYFDHGDEKKLIVAVALALQTASPEAADAASKYLLANLHDGSAWAVVLTKPTDAARLAELMFPAMKSGTLLVHPDTASAAQALLKAGGEAGTIPAEQIEDVVKEALRLVASKSLQPRLRDSILGCLRSEGIRDPELAAQRQALGDEAPELAPPTGSIDWSSDWLASDEYEGLSSETESAVIALKAVLYRTTDNNTDWNSRYEELVRTFTDADVAFQLEPELPPHVQLTLVEAAYQLAGYQALKPDTPVGERVYEVLLQAAEQEEAGRFL